MYEEYIKEVEGSEMVKDETGFAVYKFLDNGQVCYITEIYVLPPHRNLRNCQKLGDKVSEIAKERGAKSLFGSVGVGINNAERSIKMLIDYGMKLHSANEKIIYFMKEF